VWEQVFGGKEMPQAGWTLEEMSDFACEIEQKYIAAVSKENYESVLKYKTHRSNYKNTRGHKNFQTLEDIDLFLQKRNADILALHKRYYKSGNIYFNQILDDSVIADCESGRLDARREGKKIICYQIPFLWSKYLAEPDSRMKRYYACHCPWVRKSILKENSVSKSFCHCSFGHERPWLESAFGRELDGRVICSAVEENCYECAFEFDIPDDIMEKLK
jgi:hypothetical protein